MKVTKPVMVSAVRYCFVTFGTCNQKNIVALPIPAMPNERALYTALQLP
jgi:hypothetical protein